MCAEGHRPICQDTGIVNVFLEDRHGRALGGLRRQIEDAVNEGVRRAT
jgi:fumarate hydratase class I